MVRIGGDKHPIWNVQTKQRKYLGLYLSLTYTINYAISFDMLDKNK
jgi:hypothetical protein